MFESVDLGILYFINHTLAADWLDNVMVFLTNSRNWLPVYILSALFLIWKYKWHGVRMVVAVVILVSFANLITNVFIKDWIGRLRPCAELPTGLRVVEWIRLPDGMRGGFSLPSSHAVNNFCVAMFFSLLFRTRSVVITLFIVAFIVALSRPYLGLHYPSDTIIGAMMGMLLGYSFVKLFGMIEAKFFEKPVAADFIRTNPF